jgi:heat shock protein HspQ
MTATECASKFYIGQIVTHRRFGYRGVIYDVDASFMLTEKWYDTIATSEPPKDQPWYRVLVDGVDHATYVAERNLDGVADPGPIRHPLIEDYFERFDGCNYKPSILRN